MKTLYYKRSIQKQKDKTNINAQIFIAFTKR